MELIFNEISFLPHSNNEVLLKEQFINMLKIFVEIKENYGYNHIVFPINIGDIKVTIDKSFHQWAYSIEKKGDKNKILSVIKRPFGNDVLQEKVMELNKYYYENKGVGIEEEYCIGLATTYLKQKVSVSLLSNPCWDTTKIDFKEIIDDEFNTKDVDVENITSLNHLLDNNIQTKLMYSGALLLLKSPLKPDEKKLNLSGDHHGNNKLKTFSKRIFQSEYVVSVINNIDFSPNSSDLIKNTYADGKIELVLYWESAGYGMIIQTTGRNLRETDEIAKLLNEKYS